jgi:hypothetical protein
LKNIFLLDIHKYLEGFQPLLLGDEIDHLVLLGLEGSLGVQVNQADAVEEAAVVALDGRVHKAVPDGEAAEVDLLDGLALQSLVLLLEESEFLFCSNSVLEWVFLK